MPSLRHRPSDIKHRTSRGPLMPARQTQSYLRNLFARRGIVPRRRLGQNFLVDLNIHELIANAADVGPLDVVLEVGPGAGALTTLLAANASAVVAVELAPAMAPLEAADEGALSVLVQALADVEVVRVLPPSVFWPRPKVASAVVRITPRPEKRPAIGDLPWFHAVVRRLFLHRRKNLRRVLHFL